MPESVVRICCFLFFVAAGVTWVSGEVGQGLAGRIAIGDVLGAVLIFIVFARVSLTHKHSVAVPPLYRSYVPFLAVVTLGVLLSDKPDVGGIELLIHMFIFVVSLALYNLLESSAYENKFSKLIGDVLLAGGLLAIFGLAHFFLFPDLLEGSAGGLSGSFRNTGQAGSFFGVMLAIVLPGFIAGLIKPKPLNLMLLVAIALALLFTFKRAAIIGATVGLVLLSIRMISGGGRRTKGQSVIIISGTAVVLSIFYLLYGWGVENITSFEWRVDQKFGEDAAEEFSEGFFWENLESGVRAFTDSPLFGVGMGAIAGIYTSKYEIHSTYIKVLGSTGIAGVVTYLWFLTTGIRSLVRARIGEIRRRYIVYAVPLLIGLTISWSYTYHLRKREFWILILVLAVCMSSKHRRALSKGVTGDTRLRT